MTSARAVIWLLILVGVGYDVVAMLFGWQTVSEGVRLLDAESGGLVRWLWLALWMHWFIPMW